MREQKVIHNELVEWMGDRGNRTRLRPSDLWVNRTINQDINIHACRWFINPLLTQVCSLFTSPTSKKGKICSKNSTSLEKMTQRSMLSLILRPLWSSDSYRFVSTINHPFHKTRTHLRWLERKDQRPVHLKRKFPMGRPHSKKKYGISMHKVSDFTGLSVSM